MSSNYVKMGDGAGKKPLEIPGLDDPSLSQEEKDLRLAMALQQQENAAAYDAHKKRHDAEVSAKTSRTSRSSAATRLTGARLNQKDKNEAYGGSYAGPDDSSDARLAAELHKVEVTTAKTASIIAQDNNEAKTENHRSGRSVF